MRQSDIIKLLNKYRTVGALRDNICGQLLGTGLHRKVFVLKQDDRFVVKIEMDVDHAQFANVTEWRNWVNNKEWVKFSKWLAPCLAIDTTGTVLIQRRAQRIIDKPELISLLPKKIPSLLTDKKYFNFGWIGKQFVCFDYPFLVLGERFCLKRVKWWGAKEECSQAIKFKKENYGR